MSNEKMCEKCGNYPIIHQCKGGCDKHICKRCGYKCAGGCNNGVCADCHKKRMETRIRPEKTHYYCKDCIGRYSMG